MFIIQKFLKECLFTNFKIPREVSNFLPYLNCPHYVGMNEKKCKNSQEKKIDITIYSWNMNEASLFQP